MSLHCALNQAKILDRSIFVTLKAYDMSWQGFRELKQHGFNGFCFVFFFVNLLALWCLLVVLDQKHLHLQHRDLFWEEFHALTGLIFQAGVSSGLWRLFSATHPLRALWWWSSCPVDAVALRHWVVESGADTWHLSAEDVHTDPTNVELTKFELITPAVSLMKMETNKICRLLRFFTEHKKS